jgi:hypothetical protein
MLMVEPMDNDGMQGNYCFRVECKDKVFFFGTEYAQETNKWISAVRRAKKTEEEVQRTKDLKLTRNTDVLFRMYRNK